MTPGTGQLLQEGGGHSQIPPPREWSSQVGVGAAAPGRMAGSQRNTVTLQRGGRWRKHWRDGNFHVGFVPTPVPQLGNEMRVRGQQELSAACGATRAT